MSAQKGGSLTSKSKTRSLHYLSGGQSTTHLGGGSLYKREGVSTDRNQELYNLALNKPKKKDARDRSTSDIEYERNLDECTFVPDLTRTRKGSRASLHSNLAA